MPNNVSKDVGFWDDIPKSRYSRLSDFEGQLLRVYAVGDFTGEYSECFVLHAAPTTKLFDAIVDVKEVLVSKGYDTRDIICKKMQDILGSEPEENIATDTFIPVEINKRGRFVAIEKPEEM